MTRIHRRSMMVYSRLQAKFMGTQCNGDTHRYGTSIFMNTVVDVSESINNDNQILGAVKYSCVRHAKCSYCIENRTFEIFVVMHYNFLHGGSRSRCNI